jgi:hypothetical protein
MLKKDLYSTLIDGSFCFRKVGQEIGLITENDLYTSSKNDKYYTNGLEIFIGFSEEWHRESKQKNC